MKKKKIKVNINTTYKYVQLWNGIFKLTDKELTILSAFIDVNNITEESNLCSIENKRKVADIVGIKDHNTLNNYVKSFKDKRVILKKGTAYKLNSFLEPDTNIVEIEINRI